MELFRYIHLSPLRAGLVRDMNELDSSPWSGHSALMGKVEREWQDIGHVPYYKWSLYFFTLSEDNLFVESLPNSPLFDHADKVKVLICADNG